MKNTSLKIKLKVDRLFANKNTYNTYITDLEKENKAITDSLKDMAAMSYNKADELMNKVVFNNTEIENSIKKISKIDSRILNMYKKL